MNWKLEPNEPLLWEGRPDPKLHFGIETIATAIFALIVIAACTGVGWLISSVTGVMALSLANEPQAQIRADDEVDA